MEIDHAGNRFVCGGMANNGFWHQTVVSSYNHAVIPVSFCYKKDPSIGLHLVEQR